MQSYTVLTYVVIDGRITKRSFVACSDKAEAIAMSDMLNHKHNPGTHTIERRGIPCVTGYTEAGKYTIPLDELKYIKSEAQGRVP